LTVEWSREDGESKGTIETDSDMPTSGADASTGLPTQYGAAFAVASAGSVQGFTLKFVPYDDDVNGAHDSSVIESKR